MLRSVVVGVVSLGIGMAAAEGGALKASGTPTPQPISITEPSAPQDDWAGFSNDGVALAVHNIDLTCRGAHDAGKSKRPTDETDLANAYVARDVSAAVAFH